jgi:hypothetical protein
VARPARPRRRDQLPPRRRSRSPVPGLAFRSGSIILTTNLGVASWASRLGDPMVTAAMLDRLLQRAVVLGIDGPSYRLRTHQARTEDLRRAVGS